MNLSYLILGHATVAASYGEITPMLNLCMARGIPYTDIKTDSDAVRLTFRTDALSKLKREADACGITFSVEEEGGLPRLLSRYKRRFGLMTGALAAAIMIFLSGRFVFSIEVRGNESVTCSEIVQMLSDQGFGIGSYIPGVETDRIENRLLMNTDRLSWISVNLVGTVAYVEVRETMTAQEGASGSDTPANLVAARPGVVREVRLLGGNAVVRTGDQVDEGDLLVSGLFDSNLHGFRYTRAEGEVIAETVREFYVEIPYEYEKKVYTGAEIYDKYLNFFDYSINILKNSGNMDSFYDKIDIVESLYLPGGRGTPISVRTVKYLEYESVPSRRTEREAEELAYFELERLLSDASDGMVLLKKSVRARVGEESFSILCTVTSLENIARTQEFEVAEDSPWK